MIPDVSKLPREIPVMFLGGPLDHTTRMVIQSVVEPGRPAAVRYRASLKGGGTVNYEVHQIDIEGLPPWYVYIQKGYAPPRQHILHTNPN